MGILKRKIVAPGHGAFPSGQPTLLAVHSTANPGASAYNHTVYWKNNPDYAVHVVSDAKEAFQCVEWDRKCWQVGNGNHTCIGIEICEETNINDFLKGLAIARQAIWDMLNMKGWGVDRVRSHKWFTNNYGGSDHVDPDPYFAKFGWTWDMFIQYLKEGEDDMALTKEQMNEFCNAIWSWDNHGLEVEQVYKEVMRTDDPTGRGREMTDHDHIKWLAKEIQSIKEMVTEDHKMMGRIAKLLDKQDSIKLGGTD